MSLHNAARHIAAHGRGEDTILVHMTPKEVGSLQAVAKAHGGSLTINPHTGLAEAGFLKGLLPTLLGAGLAATGVGAPMAALMVGGGYAAASGGDLKKGLMAGLGAYGGAGMYGAMNPAAVPTPATPAPVAATPTPSVPDWLKPPSVTPTPTPLAEVANVTPTSGPLSGINPETGIGPNGYVGNTITPASPAVGSPAQLAQQSMAPPVQPTNLATTATTPSYTPAAKSFEDAAWGKYGAASAASTAAGAKEDPKAPSPADPGMIRPYTFDRVRNEDAFLNTAGGKPLSSKEQRYFTDTYTAQTPYKAPGPEYMAAGGPVETMSNQAAMGANTMYPMANMATSSFATPYQSPVSTNMLAPTSDSPVGMTGEPSMQGTRMAGGGQVPQYGLGGALGGYSDGGRMLKGPGDGMSDNIPAVIGKKQPARLADGEFVVPADVVSHLGNGSTDAGAKQLYAMMDKIRAARTGTKKQGKQINPRKYMPA